MNPKGREGKELLDIRVGEECLLCLMGQHFLVRILGVDKDEVELSFPGRDYPVEGMPVELQFHDESGFNCYRSDVVKGPGPERKGILVRKPTEMDRSQHRRTCRVATDLTVQVKDHVHVRKYDAELLNLSAGGALMKTRAPFDFSTNVELTLSLPGEHTRTLLGHVVHMDRPVKPVEEDEAYILGVKFIGVDPEAAQAITRFVWTQLKERFPSA